MTLKDLNSGEKAEVIEIKGENALRRRIMDIGILPGVCIEIAKRAPLGDPIQVSTGECDLIIRKSEAEKIIISLVKNEDNDLKDKNINNNLSEF
jgi:Fe2+ transport system protein FeoA